MSLHEEDAVIEVRLSNEMLTGPTEKRPSPEENLRPESRKRIEIVEPKTRGDSTDWSTDADAFAPPKETLKERRMTARLEPVICDIHLPEESEPDFIKELKKLATEKVTGRDILLIGGTRSSRDIGYSGGQKLPDPRSKDSKTIRSKRWVPKLINPLFIELTRQQMKDLHDAFDLLEDPKTGMVRDCSIETLIRACGTDPTPEVMAGILERIQPSYPGYFTFDEFVRTFKRLMGQEDSIEQIRKAFKLMEHNEPGRITLEDLNKVVKITDYGLNVEEIKEMMEEAASDSEDGVSMSRFVKLMTKKPYYDS